MCSRVKEAESLNTPGEDGLLRMLVEAVQELKALRSRRDGRLGATVEKGWEDGGGGNGGEEEAAEGGSPDEQECFWKVMHVLREVSVSHSGRVASWRGALRECVSILAASPPEGSSQPPNPGRFWSRQKSIIFTGCWC